MRRCQCGCGIAMRVIAGTLKGRRLKTPTWDGLRPTSDKLRETLFNVLAPRVAGARVLDGYAGTGAVGIEAISRGAAHVTFVESDRRAQALIAANLASLRNRERLYYDPRERRAGVQDARSQFPRSCRSISSCSIRRTSRRRRRALAGADALVAPDGWVVLEHARRVAAPDRDGRLRPDPRPAIRRQRAGLLHMPTLAVYPGIVRSADQRPRRHHRRAARGSSIASSSRSLVNAEKSPLFTRRGASRDRPRRCSRTLPNVEVDTFDGLLVDYVERRAGAGHRARPARGLRLRVRVPDGADEPAPEW